MNMVYRLPCDSAVILKNVKPFARECRGDVRGYLLYSLQENGENGRRHLKKVLVMLFGNYKGMPF